MPIYPIPYSKERGAEIEVTISKPASTFTQAEVDASKCRVKLLIDTGASRTAINPKFINMLGVASKGKTPVKGMSPQDVESGLYVVDLAWDRPSPPLQLNNLTIMEFQGDWRDGVLGRDFLEKVMFEINGLDKEAQIVV